MRAAVEWYKRIARAGLGPLSGEETKYLNERWGYLIRQLVEKEQLPPGWLSYSLAQLAQDELRLVDTAAKELGV
jgi:hypothetical protein